MLSNDIIEDFKLQNMQMLDSYKNELKSELRTEMEAFMFQFRNESNKKDNKLSNSHQTLLRASIEEEEIPLKKIIISSKQNKNFYPEVFNTTNAVKKSTNKSSYQKGLDAIYGKSLNNLSRKKIDRSKGMEIRVDDEVKYEDFSHSSKPNNIKDPDVIDERERKLSSGTLSILQKSQLLLLEASEMTNNGKNKKFRNKNKSDRFAVCHSAADQVAGYASLPLLTDYKHQGGVENQGNLFSPCHRNYSIQSYAVSRSPSQSPKRQSPSPTSALAQSSSSLWTSQRVTDQPTDALDAFTPPEWENQIARHIVSVYSSSRVEKDGQSAAAILSYAKEIDPRDLDQDPPKSAMPPCATARRPSSRQPPSSRPASRQPALPPPSAPAKRAPVVLQFGLVPCAPIWPIASGAVYADWTRLPGGTALQANLDLLYEHQRYKDYLGVVETLLNGLLMDQTAVHTISETARLQDSDQVVVHWRQLVHTAVAFATLSIERKALDQALSVLLIAEKYAANDGVLRRRDQRADLIGSVHNVFAYYFYLKKMCTSALMHCDKAMECHGETGSLLLVATTILHASATYCKQANFKMAHKKLYHFLAMVEDGQLGREDASCEQLSLVAIGYHNLAVLQLKMQAPHLACKSSQNARKVARLCLSYSNRWIDTFQRTHTIAIDKVKKELNRLRDQTQVSEAQQHLIDELTDALFDPTPSD